MQVDDQAENDAEIVRRSLHDPEAFSVILRRHGDSVFRFLSARVGAETADRLWADVAYEAFRSRGRFEPERATALPWLYGISANVIGRHRREEARHFARIADAATPLPVEDDPSVAAADALDALALRPQLFALLRALPDHERDTLLLHAWEQLSDLEIAEVLGLAPGTVRSRLSRARARLRAGLEPSATPRPKQVTDG